MKRFLKASVLLAAAIFITGCKKDDDSDIPPPRDPVIQYATEKPAIQDYLETHYIEVDSDFNATFGLVDATHPVSIMDQTQYPIQHKMVTYNNVEYTLYYLSFRQGVDNQPTRGDNVLTAYKGQLMDDENSVFDESPFPQNFSLLSGTIEGWQRIIPLFKAGTVASGNPQDPASFQDYGAGVMFLPSALAYYNYAQSGIPAYSPLIFTFKLYRAQYLDTDRDGILNKDEKDPTQDPATADVADYDSDGDGRPNYLDADDDGDGFYTVDEIRIPGTNPIEYYDFEDIPACGTGTIKKHLDPTCH